MKQGIDPLQYGKYTQRELAELQLGWLIINEEQEAEQSGRSKPRSHTRRKAREIARQRSNDDTRMN